MIVFCLLGWLVGWSDGWMDVAQAAGGAAGFRMLSMTTEAVVAGLPSTDSSESAAAVQQSRDSTCRAVELAVQVRVCVCV